MKSLKKPTVACFLFFLAILLSFVASCKKDTPTIDPVVTDGLTDEEIEESRMPCPKVGDYVFSEKDGLVSVEFEDAEFSSDWKLQKFERGFSGKGYMVWTGTQYFEEPGNGTASFKIKITNSGIYKFLWKTAVTIGDDSTEHNDTWLRFSDADDFYAQNLGSIVYPRGLGKEPNPLGVSKDGWFKVYRSGSNLEFKWEANTYDNNAHAIFISFENPGTYLMEVSARSTGHGIDKFVLFNSTVEESNAISAIASEITCN